MDVIMNSPQFSPSPSIHQQQIQVDEYDYTLQTQDESKSVPTRQAGPALCVNTLSLMCLIVPSAKNLIGMMIVITLQMIPKMKIIGKVFHCSII
jgi:hypothetical protein